MITNQKVNFLKELLLTLLFFSLIFALVMISLNYNSQLALIERQGKLRVVTLNSPMSWYLLRGEPAGFEYELAQAFADYLGVELDLSISSDHLQLLETISNRSAHFAAANLLATESKQDHFHFGPIYRETHSIIVYRQRQGRRPPQSLSELSNQRIGVVPGTTHEQRLLQLSNSLEHLIIINEEMRDPIDLLRGVHEGELDFAVVDQFFFGTQRSFFPGLQSAFDLDDPAPVSWLLPPQRDNSLIEALNRFFAEPSTLALIESLEERYFAQENPLNYFDTISFRAHLNERFMPFSHYFEQAAQETEFDLSLLAAVGYQESLWDPEAVSPTGVRGIMMLTNAAASEVGVEDRTDPKQSIFGGAHYLLAMKQRIPEKIPEPDRTWFALAAYNIGLGHLQDARRLTQQLGGNRDRWADVRAHLPKLAQERYYTQLRHGYARGHEPVRYVDNIRRFIDVFEWEFGILMNSMTMETATEDTPQSQEGNADSFRDISEKVLRNFAPSL